MTRTDESRRRRELLSKLLEYSADHGLSEVSLRPLAAAVGSSPRMLLYFFGSKEGLVREVHRHAREAQLALLADALGDRLATGSRADALRALWEWLSDPAHHNVVRFFFESYARSLHAREDAWEGFGEASVREWLPHIRRALGSSDAEATLVLAALRGLMLDLLATGDTERVRAGFESLVAGLPVEPA
ncbi:TetR family transcriptional regulator [Saccharopolyspora erythraea NRRL 2338]|uniref:Transcriptional regulator, TetR family n=2 Tax=Saccharopolyspora erythraea TaxID=1836 RepID=A4F6H8_SACEN|nr:TetR/AcrR family transcriptional regulator [Saccharopolyspora erythraea]EQD85404.1 TetR family transcriptional regulator [Saccharopolyspora erythraea D]PFG93455.1 TetR family transcriptional regulator [Saccharopolyspora erythraea NRRL 2338]QRK90325.1 TetR/AcrR family transcriptional regulator [Saccharopolyspora erythraea]CAL99652.1 transcriptional regulator, TetR family [Saccharopolyspora erythraea NRRL 2338]